MKRYRPYTVWMCLLLFLGALLALSAFPVPSLADLPKRATPLPRDEPDQLTGAHIELQVWGAPGGTWSVVQWQANDGAWHNVNGWRSQLGYGGSVRWWVAPSDLGAGPFRWVLTDGELGPMVAASDPFNLPAAVNETLRVELTFAR